MSAQAGWALTRTLKKLSMVAAAICAHAANGSVAGADECHAVTSIEIVHRTGSSTTTSTVRLAPGASADPNQALRAFQRAADHFGQENIVSSRPIRTVQCMEAESPNDLARASAVSILGSELCVLDDEVYSCEALPGDGFDYGEGTNCSVFDMGEALSYTCDYSGLIISDQGDVVITVNSANIQAEVLARTQALRRLLGDANVLTNFHFNIVLSPDQEAALVSNDSFAEVADEIGAPPSSATHSPTSRSYSPGYQRNRRTWRSSSSSRRRTSCASSASNCRQDHHRRAAQPSAGQRFLRELRRSQPAD